MAALIPRTTPGNNAVPGGYTCVQYICGSSAGCVTTGVELQCINALPNGFNMIYNGFTMVCDSTTHPYPLNSCTCQIDFLNCDSKGPINKSTTTPKAISTTTKIGSTTTSPKAVITTPASVGGVVTTTAPAVVQPAASTTAVVLNTPTPTKSAAGTAKGIEARRAVRRGVAAVVFAWLVYSASF